MKYKGRHIYEGIAMGSIATVVSIADVAKEYFSVEKEISRFRRAIKNSKKIIEETKMHFDEINFNGISILNIYLSILEDPYFLRDIESKIILSDKIAEIILIDVLNGMKRSIIGSQYSLRDLKEVIYRILVTLNNVKYNYDNLDDKIIVTEYMDLISFMQIFKECKNIRGIVFRKINIRSHLASLLKFLKIPSITNVEDFSSLSRSKDRELIIDSRLDFDLVVINPKDEEKIKYLKLIDRYVEDEKSLSEFNNLSLQTKDGKKIVLSLQESCHTDLGYLKNILHDEIFISTEDVFNREKTLPNQERQIEIYKSLFDSYKGPISVSLFNFNSRNAPRIISSDLIDIKGSRFLLLNKGILKNQIKAILQASLGRDLTIVYPLVTTVDEVVSINKILEECQEEISKLGLSSNKEVKVGVMIESPSSALIADRIIDLSDTLVINSTVLSQYILVSEELSNDLFDQFSFIHPAILRIIDRVAYYCNERGKRLKVTGEIVNFNLGLLSVLALGVDEIIIKPELASKVKKMLSTVEVSQLDKIKKYILNSDNSEVNKSILQMVLSNI